MSFTTVFGGRNIQTTVRFKVLVYWEFSCISSFRFLLLELMLNIMAYWKVSFLFHLHTGISPSHFVSFALMDIVYPKVHILLCLINPVMP